MISDRLDITLSLFRTTIQGDKHAPSVRVLGPFSSSSGLLRVLNFFVGISKGKFHKTYIAEPFACSFKFCLALFKLISHGSRNLLLQLSIDLRHEQLVKMCTAHGASHTSSYDLLIALETHEVLAGSEHWLCTQFQADRALVVITTRTQDSWTAVGGSCSTPASAPSSSSTARAWSCR